MGERSKRKVEKVIYNAGLSLQILLSKILFDSRVRSTPVKIFVEYDILLTYKRNSKTL